MIETPNQSQIAGQLRTALAAGGPIAALIMSKTGISQEDYGLYLELALYIVPPLIAAVWSYIAKRDAAIVKAAAKVPGATVVVDQDRAPPAVKDIAQDQSANPAVVTKEQYQP